MELAPREPAPQRLDRVLLTEHVPERHAPVIGSPQRGRKRPLRAAWLSAALAAASCGSPPSPSPIPKPTYPDEPATAEHAPAAIEPSIRRPPSPIDEARRLLALAATTTDAHERCRLLHEATNLDPTSREARLARAESRCAPASDLLADARAAHRIAADATSAAVLATVATRAGSREDALAAVDLLLAADLSAKELAASTLARFGEHARAATAFESIADERSAKGASVDALDAKLDAIVERARAGETNAARAALVAALGEAEAVAKGYGAAWIGPKLVSAIAAIRNAGDAKGAAAVAAKARATSTFSASGARAAHDVERAIAAAREGRTAAATALIPAARARIHDRGSRALLAVHARAIGACASAKAHARAYEWLPSEGVHLDDDVAWARECRALEFPATVVAPAQSDDVQDALSFAPADPLRARARLQAILAARPRDVGAHLAAIDVAPAADRANVAAAAAAALPAEPWIQLARITSGPTSSGGALLKALDGTIEAKVPRAAAPILARAVLASDDLDLAEALLRACAASSTGACLDAARAPALARATSSLRIARPAALAAAGPLLSNGDLQDARVRLDVVLALVARKQLAKAEALAGPSRGAWSGPESRLARAAILAARGKCADARADATLASDLESYADVLATIASCQ